MRWFNGAVLLTLVRLFLVPVMALFLYQHNFLSAFFIVLLAGLTDLFDGWYARRFGYCTFFGACLDTVTDKILVLVGYGMMTFFQVLPVPLPWWFLAAIGVRELTLLIGGFVVCCTYMLLPVSPSRMGKLTGIMHVGFMSMLLLGAYTQNAFVFEHIQVIAGLVVGFIFISWIEYVVLLVRTCLYK